MFRGVLLPAYSRWKNDPGGDNIMYFRKEKSGFGSLGEPGGAVLLLCTLAYFPIYY